MKNNKTIKCSIVLLLFLSLAVIPVFAEEPEESPEFGFGMAMDLGVATFMEYNEESDADEAVTYQRIGFIPEFSYGKFGLSLDLSFHVKSDPDDQDMPFKMREEDWVPDDDTSFLELYLPKFNYIRYGEKGENLYVKLGTIADATLGTGFIMSNYSNGMFLPNEKLFGMSLDMDGNLFSFPYLGFESFVGNLANPDVFGGRLYGRPLAWSSFPIVESLEVGFTVASDINPDSREEYFTALDYFDVNDDDDIDDGIEIDPVTIWGIDLIQPILSNPVVSLAAFTSLAVEPVEDSTSTGFMLGAGGRLISFIPYMIQLRFLGENFVPSYFDASYDLYRAQKYAVMMGAIDIDSFVGWLASSGFSLLDDQIVFNASIDGPFETAPDGDILDHSPSEYPHLRLTFLIAEGLLPGIFFDAYYDKQYITSFGDIFDQEGAVIGANINYKTGPAIITLNYDVKYDPSTGDYVTAAKLMTSIGLF